MKKLLSIIAVITFGLTTTAQQNWQNITDTYLLSKIVPDGQKIWLASEGGLICIDQTNSDTVYFNNANSEMPFTEVSDICIDNQGCLWVTSPGGGIASKHGDIWNHYHSGNSALPNNRAYSIAANSSGEIWAGLSHFLVKFDGNNWISYSFDSLGGDILFPSSIAFDKDDRVLIGAYGIRAWDGENLTIYNTSNSPLVDNQISQIKTFPDGKTWIGHPFSGLTITDFSNWAYYDTLVPGNRLYKVYAFDRTSEGHYWLGTYSKELYYYDGNTWQLRSPSAPVDSIRYIRSMTVDQNGKLYVVAYPNCTFDGESWQILNTPGTGFKGNIVRDILHAPDQSAWIANNYGMTQIKNNQVTNYHHDDTDDWVSTTCFARDNDDKIYAAHYKGICCFENGSWKRISLPGKNKTGLNYHIDCMCFDHQNNLWYFEAPYLVKFDGTTSTYYSALNNNFPSFDLYCLTVDPGGNIIAGIDNGIVKQNGNSWTTITIPDPPVTDLKVWKVIIVDDMYWMATSGGLIKYDGAAWEYYNPDNTILPDFFIKAMDIDSEDNLWFINGANNLVKFDQQNFEIIPFLESGMLYGPHTVLHIDAADNIWFGGYDCGITIYNSNGITLNTQKDSKPSTGLKIIRLAYPNPVTGELKVDYKLPDHQHNYMVNIRDAQGKLIDVIPLNTDHHTFTYSTDRLSSGLYLMSVNNGKQDDGVPTKFMVIKR
ncbi:T9SS type A sorting domain-containing protein [Lentimicrobium sp.]|uniref:T9SS type A sorting domain-containing protein n=1 Tax=Lentimicrobium sp. TaxID=2034841 RepID=UPI00345E9D17